MQTHFLRRDRFQIMSKKQNPYHLWLGLPAETTSPNFFQLLEIAPNAADDKQIAASARTNAQQLLDRLKKVPVKSDGEKAVRQKLKARIVKAHKTISDPAKRKQYADALAAKHSVSGILPAVEPPNPPNQIASPPPVAPPTSPNPTPPPISNTPANIPQAIPLARPLESAPQQTSVAPAADDQFAGISDEETIRVRPVRARGKRSSIVPIVVTLLVISVIGGLVSFLTSYKNVFEVLAEREQGGSTETNIATPFESDLQDVKADPDKADPDADSEPEPLKVPKKFENLAASQAKRTQDGSGDKEVTSGKSTPEKTSNDDMARGSESKAMDNDDNDTPEVSPAEQAASASVARVAANLVRSALARRDTPAAKTANEQIKRLADADFLSGETKSLLKKEHAQNEHMIAHIEVFLGQLRSAAEEMPGGQDVKVGKLIMGLLDANPTEVTLRRAGRNEVIPYSDLPNSVALALGDQGSKKSVPKWNMAKAADLIIMSQYNPSLQEKAEPFLTQSISDGYDMECEAISAYSDTLWQEEHLPKRSADPTLDQVAAELKEFRAANGYKNPKGVKPEMAPALIEELLFSPTSEPKQRVARLSEAIAIAARQREFDTVLVATGELYQLSNPVHSDDMVVTPINRCMRTDMTAAQARHLVHTIIAMVKQHSERRNFNKNAKDKLVRHAQTLVEEFEFSALSPRVKQLAK